MPFAVREASQTETLKVSDVIFDAYEVSWRAGTEDLLYNAMALFRPESGFPDQMIRRSVFELLPYSTLYGQIMQIKKTDSGPGFWLFSRYSAVRFRSRQSKRRRIEFRKNLAPPK